MCFLYVGKLSIYLLPLSHALASTADCDGGVCVGNVEACHDRDGEPNGDCEHGRICCALPDVEQLLLKAIQDLDVHGKGVFD